MDEVGLDVAGKAAKVMHHAFGDRLEPSEVIERMLGDGRQGRKNGKGFYLYPKGKKAGPDESVYDLLGLRPKATLPAEEISRRLSYLMLNEAAMAHGEGVVRSARDGDIGAIFGIGFPPFRGGPLRYLDQLGATTVVQGLRELAERYGPRYTPAEVLVAMAERGERFYLA
jgi:3-hydroxyacyl-CoA dehydrogenase/enoyl-CoA hydratase/3-hydroxybutyryl-CoA epimerase